METQFDNEIKNEEYINYSAPQPEAAIISDPANRKYGLGKAIAATIVSIFAVSLSVVALFFVSFGFLGVEPELLEFGWSMLAFGSVFSCLAIPAAVVSLILGIKSILSFKKVTPRPIATLILGIVATSTAVDALIVVFANLIYAVILFAALIVV